MIHAVIPCDRAVQQYKQYVPGKCVTASQSKRLPVIPQNDITALHYRYRTSWKELKIWRMGPHVLTIPNGKKTRLSMHLEAFFARGINATGSDGSIRSSRAPKQNLVPNSNGIHTGRLLYCCIVCTINSKDYAIYRTPKLRQRLGYRQENRTFTL